MIIKREDFDEITLLKLHGEMGTIDIKSLKKVIVQLIEEGRVRIVMDLEEVDFIGSQAILVLLRLNREVLASGGSIKLLRPGNVVRRFLSIGRVIELFDRYETRVDAFNAFKKSPIIGEKPVDRLEDAARKQREVLNRLIELLAEKGLINRESFNSELTRSTYVVMKLFQKEFDFRNTDD